MSTPNRKEQREQARAERKAQEAALARAQRRKRRLGIVGGIVAVAAALVIALVALSAPSDKGTERLAGDSVTGESQTKALLAGIPQDGRFLGSPEAPVTLVEFADVQCPFCKEYTDNALPTVIADYVKTGKVRLEFRPRSFLGDDSVKGAKLVAAAGRQDKLWNTLEILYANQGAENSGWLSDDLATKALTAAGANAAEAKAAAGTPEVQADLTAADTLASQNGLNSTPSFLVGKTGGTLKPLEVQALDGAFFSSALDKELPAT